MESRRGSQVREISADPGDDLEWAGLAGPADDLGWAAAVPPVPAAVSRQAARERLGREQGSRNSAGL